MQNSSRDTNRIVAICGTALNLTQMSQDLGISLSHLSRLFSGQRNPSLATCTRILDYLQIDLDTLQAEIAARRQALKLRLDSQTSV